MDGVRNALLFMCLILVRHAGDGSLRTKVRTVCGEPAASPCSNTKNPVSVTRLEKVDNAIRASRRQRFRSLPVSKEPYGCEDDPRDGPQGAWKLRTLATRNLIRRKCDDLVAIHVAKVPMGYGQQRFPVDIMVASDLRIRPYGSIRKGRRVAAERGAGPK